MRTTLAKTQYSLKCDQRSRMIRCEIKKYYQVLDEESCIFMMEITQENGDSYTEVQSQNKFRNVIPSMSMNDTT